MKKQEFRREKKHFKPFWCIFLVVAMLFIIQISMVSAFEFDNIKELPDNFNYRKSIVTIRNSFLWIFPLGKVADIQMIENTDQCLINCKTKFKVKLYADYKNPLTREYFKDRENKNVDVSGEWYYYDNSSYDVEIPEYKEICELNPEPTNDSKTCSQEQTGSHNETRYNSQWLRYDGGTFKEGEYEFEYRGRKPINKDVDFKVVLFGVDLGKEYVWWNFDWNKKREINITENSGSDLRNYSVAINVTYDSDMLANFSDLRFLNSAESEELGYWIESKSDSNWAYVWVKVPTLTASANTSIYMYYNGSVTATTSNISNAFLWGDDASSNKLSSYVTSGATSWNSGDETYTIGSTGAAFRGKIQKGIYEDGSKFRLKFNSSSAGYPGILFHTSSDFSTTAGSGYLLLMQIGTDHFDWYKTTLGFNGRSQIDDTSFTITANTYYIIEIFKEGTTTNITIHDSDFVSLASFTSTDNTYTSGYVGYFAWDNFYKLDDIIIRNFTISEPTYFIGDEESESILTITLNFPVDYYNSTSDLITFNGTAFNDVGISNVSLIIDGIYNETNSSGFNNTNYIFTKTLSEGTHNWTMEACDAIECKNATVRNLEIDSILPDVNITYPPETISYHILNTNLSLNWTVSDTNLDSCWYNYNGTNISITCSDNHTNINITEHPNRNVTFYANDTFGNLNSDYQEWDYKIFENIKTYNSSSFETETETFYMNITTNGTVPANAKLIYNGISYSATTTNTYGNDYDISRIIDIPTGAGNKSFFFNLTIAGDEMSSPVQTQLINLTNFTYCIIGTPFINISFENETIAGEDITAIIYSTWNYWLGSGDIYKTLSFSNASENPSYSFCLDGVNKTLETNVSLIYTNSISQQRNFQGSFSLTNVTTNQTLYLLPTVEGIYVTFQVISVAEQPIAGVVANVTKAGILIASGITDDAGTISYFLNPDSSYTFTFFKEGYDIYITTLTPTQTTFTITLGAEEVIEEADYTRGITYSISPGAISLVNGTNTYFNFTLTSVYWEVEEFGFNLTNQDGALLDSTSASASGGTVFILHDTSNDTTITMTFFWTVEGNVSIGSTFWTVVDSSGTGWGLTTFFTHLTAYLDTEMFGLNSNSMVILIYIIIFITVGVMSFKYGIRSPAAISVMIFGLVFLFEVHLNWIPSVSGFPIVTILFAIMSIALILKEELR